MDCQFIAHKVILNRIRTCAHIFLPQLTGNHPSEKGHWPGGPEAINFVAPLASGPHDEGQETVGSRWVITRKEKLDGQKQNYKGRLVAKEFQEKEAP